MNRPPNRSRDRPGQSRKRGRWGLACRRQTSTADRIYLPRQGPILLGFRGTGVRNGLTNGSDDLPRHLPVLHAQVAGKLLLDVTRTSLGIRRAQVAKKTVGLVLAVLTIASRPSSDQTSARSFRKAWLNTVRLPTGRPFGFPDCPGCHMSVVLRKPASWIKKLRLVGWAGPKAAGCPRATTPEQAFRPPACRIRATSRC